MHRLGGARIILIFMFAISITFGVWGCDQLPFLGGKKEETQKPKPKPPPKAAPTKDTSTPVLTEEEERKYVYDPTDKRDPFQPFIATHTPIMPPGEEIPITPLQQYDLSQLKLVAILVGTEEGRAMVEDAEGKGYIVEKGVYVGRNFGKVKAVLKDRVVIEERFKDYMGKVKTKEIVLELHTPGEEEQP